MAKKHAFLITAHHQPELLQKLLSALDHERVDFYLHWDKKSPLSAVDHRALQSAVQHGKLVFTPSISVNWGGYSQIRCELLLWKTALQSGEDYAHLHLISGADFPLKNVEEILAFFDAHPDREFVHFSTRALQPAFSERFTVFHPFQEKMKKNSLLEKLEWRLVKWQKTGGVHRNRKEKLPFAKGANWCSITPAFAAYLVQNEKRIRRIFSFSRCCDEIFVQTFLLASPFAENLYMPTFADDYRSILRYIDWKRGEPYVFREADFEELISCGFLFARKFDIRLDSAIIDRLYRFVKREEEK